ncbi:Disease resistance protein [Citrus sinensis]|uniref:Disease resistance protein n=1 Tax=Citrus sinensis TaxID=2711 RepID=A0ACB8KET7_CITSI|nr:Disease resistance protein [Citrus sinensis]
MAVEFCLGGFSSIVSEGAKSLFKPIIRQISYVFKYQSYVDELKDQVMQLGCKREMVQQPVNHARLQGDELYEGVADWLHSVDEFISEGVANSIIDDENGAKKYCFKGLCPNLLSRYKLSKKAAKAAKDAADLVGKGNFSSVSYRPAPKSTEYMQVKDYEAFDSRKKVFQDVLEALKDDKLNIIGVYGMGGVGKTTLVKQVAKQVTEDKLFDKVAMAEVTENPDHQKIQDKLASDLGIKFELNESIFDRANRLCRVLKNEERHLIILDNIWGELKFDEVGIPSGDVKKERMDDQRRCTIILTSRRQDLLHNVMNSQKEIQIDALSKEEALYLFQKIVGDSMKTSAFQPIAHEIVGRCGELPVALITLAKALKNMSLETWKYVLRQLRSSYAKEIDGMEKNVYLSLKLSYDLLGNKEAKSLFLLCGLFSEGHAIPVSSLLRYGMGMGYFRNVYTPEEARSTVHTLISKLKSSCLLLDGDAEDEVKMHDVIRVVAVSIAKEELMFNIPNVADLDKKMEETVQEGPIAISLPYRGIQVLPERLQCPRLELLLLLEKGGGSMPISDHFFDGTEGLRVLNFTGIHFSSLPSSLGRLINLQTLCLEYCRLKDIVIVGQLKKLEILSFRGSDIERLPLEFGQLTRLQLLDLSNCRRLELRSCCTHQFPNIISKLSRLEELYMGCSFSQWDKVEGGSNASLVELKGLSKLTTLEIDVPDPEILPQDLVSVELQRYQICIGKVQRNGLVSFATSRASASIVITELEKLTSETSRSMKLQELENVSILLENYGMKMLLKRTEDLRLVTLNGVPSVVHELDDGEGFPQLEHLLVAGCPEILHIVGSIGRARCKVFPLLETLYLIGLTNLETICYSQLREDQSFSNLRIIKVFFCDKLKHLFSFFMAKNLLRLQKVEVENCDDLKMIIGPDMEKPTATQGLTEIIAEDDSVHKVIFPRLEELKLIWLTTIEKLWPEQFQGVSYCGNLTKMTVESCDRLKYLFSYSMVNSLLQLQHLVIRSCKSMEGVVDTTGWLGGRDEGKLIELEVFPKLHSLRLCVLPKLTSFANTGHIHSDLVVEFPSLLNLEIGGCNNMLRFISTSSPADTLHSEMQSPPLFDEKVGIPGILVNLNVSICKKIEEIIGHVGEEAKENRIAFSKLKLLILDDLPRLASFCLENYTLEFPSLEQIGFRDIKYLQLSHFPRLQEIWHGQALPVSFFNNLGHLVVDDCTNMSSAIPANLLRCLNNLMDLEVRNCDSLAEVAFPQLMELKLSRLHKVQHLWKENDESNKAFANMGSLEISERTSKNLVNLQRMKIADCKMIEEIIQLQVGEEVKGCIVFEKMNYLTLHCLTGLTSFCSGNYTLQFPSLEQVIARQCPKMKIFSQGVVDTPKLNKVKLTEEKDDEDEEDDDDEGCWEGNLNDTIKQLFNEMVSIN